MRVERLGGFAAIALLATMGSASAVTFNPLTCNCTVTATIAPAGGSVLTLEDYGTSGTAVNAFLSANPITVQSGGGTETIMFAGGFPNPSGLYAGNQPNIALSPLGNPLPANTPNRNYLVAEGGGGNVISTYSVAQHEFDLLWGSVDTAAGQNTVTFLLGPQGNVTGGEIIAALGGASGVQNIDVRITTAGAFTQVVANDVGANAFEFIKGVVPAPEPTSLAILGAALAGLGILRRRKTA